MTCPARVVVRLAVVLGILAAGLAFPAWWFFGVLGWEALAYCVAACLIPGVILAWVARGDLGADRLIRLLLIGTAVRVGFVAGVGLLIVALRPELRVAAFPLLLSFFYLAALVVETRELLAESRGAAKAAS